MSGEKVSLLIWRDPKTDPPRSGDGRDVLALIEYSDGARNVQTTPASSLLQHMWVAWAEIPAPTEATLDDLKNGARTLRAEGDLFKGIAADSDLDDDDAAQVEEDASRSYAAAARLRTLLPGDNHA